jgi:hypothetical protein
VEVLASRIRGGAVIVAGTMRSAASFVVPGAGAGSS